MLRNLILVPVLLLTACEDVESLAVRVYGEPFIEEGLPAEVFVDGWSVNYDRFLVVLGDVSVGQGGEPQLSEPGYQVFDLTRPSDGAGQAVVEAQVEHGRYDDTGFVIAPAADAVAGNASAADLQRMRDGGYSVYVAGTASKGEATLEFAWGFATRTVYSACESLAEVSGGRPGSVQLTIHGDHLFYDDLFSETPNVSFGLIAGADSDGDGEVTRAELEAVDLGPLANYQVGSTGITDLWRFIEHQTTTLGHIDGEGHCEATREQ